MKRRKIQVRDPKHRRITIRLGEGEYQRLKALAHKKTRGNISRLARHYLLEGMREKNV